MDREFYEDCPVGDRVRTPGRTITETDVVMFAAFSGDWNSMHTDREYAERESPYGQRIAHGLLGLVVGTCLLSRVNWFTLWPRSMICLTGLDKVRFLAPILIDDTIHLEAEIVEKLEMPEGTGLIVTRIDVRNQRGESVITGRIKMKAGRRPPAEDSIRRSGDQ